MSNALIGYSGFVGNLLVKQNKFEFLYRSTNIHEIKNKSFDTVICAGAPAQKWIANKNPQADLQTINLLIENLKTIKCKKFILVSTIDVFKNPQNVNEKTIIDEEGLHAYGMHRRLLEKFVENYFNNYLIDKI